MFKHSKYSFIFLIMITSFLSISLIGCEKRKEVISVTVESGAVKNNQPTAPTQLSKDADELMADENSGIVSFEFSSRQVSGLARKSLSREEIIQSMAEAVAGIEDDMKAKNMVIDMVSGAGFKLTAAEFILILGSAHISDSFYYANAVMLAAPYLAYPLSEKDMWKIADPVADEHYRYKLLNDLKREQAKNQ